MFLRGLGFSHVAVIWSVCNELVGISQGVFVLCIIYNVPWFRPGLGVSLGFYCRSLGSLDSRSIRLEISIVGSISGRLEVALGCL